MSTPITREHFISPDHVLTALRGPNWPHAPAMMSIITDDGQLQDVPVPAEWVQQGVLPQGYAVDFLFDPEELVLKVKNSGKNYIEEIPPQAIQSMMGIVNDVGNLKIVPQWLYDRKRELTSASVAQNTTPEAVIAQMKQAREEDEGASGSDGKKEKKKDFFKGLFGKK